MSIKCPSCGADMKGRAVCEACGKKADGVPDRVDVEYKDFKISEFLEIRPRYGTVKDTGVPPYDDSGRANDPSLQKAARITFSKLVPIIVILAFVCAVIFLLDHFSLW